MEITLKFVLAYGNHENAPHRDLRSLHRWVARQPLSPEKHSNEVLTHYRLLCRFNRHEHLSGDPQEQFFCLNEYRQQIKVF